MTNNDAAEFSKLLTALAEIFREPVSDARIEAYFEALSGFSIEALKLAASRIAIQSQFFPRPMNFVEALQGTREDRGTNAWNLLVTGLTKFSAWSSIEVHDDAAFAYALERVFGSWIHCGDTLPDSADPMYASLRKQFIATYHAYQTSGSAVTLPRRFAGRHEANNAQTMPTWRAGVALPAQPVFVLAEGGWSTHSDRRIGAGQPVAALEAGNPESLESSKPAATDG